MKAVTIYDAPELAHVIATLGDEALSCEWACSGVECFGERAEELHELSDTGRRLSGHKLLAIASGISQTIEGYFRAFRDGEPQPWIIVRAVEGEFDVQTDESAIFARVRDRFQ